MKCIGAFRTFLYFVLTLPILAFASETPVFTGLWRGTINSSHSSNVEFTIEQDGAAKMVLLFPNGANVDFRGKLSPAGTLVLKPQNEAIGIITLTLHMQGDSISGTG